ncbi:hypothetical protein [Brevundimonas sp. Root1423]|uniref:hypothetical protein n=1 Tax=Brevundimonas sp. Root1423 TaxID=1736462 RepID=UPI0012E3F187|nr:hypothetical protein [Brevundimonas sp. Root1423]
MSLILSLAALAAAPALIDPTYGPYTADQTEFIGWVRFSNGEFQLYGDEQDARRPIAPGCVSGAAPRGEMDQARGDLRGQKVKITGRAVPWNEATNHRIEHRGSNIRNDCGAAFVVVADDIRPAN